MKKTFLLILAGMMSIVAGATTYQKVTSVSDLTDGAVVVMANETAGKISGACAGKYLYAVDATFSNGSVDATGATEITLTASNGAWKLKVGTKTIGNNNSADLNNEGKGTTTYTISIDASGNAVIANTVASNGTFYYNGGSPRFKTYTSNTMSPIQLYKKVEGSNPTMTLSVNALAFDKKALADGSATDSKTLTVTTSDLKNENLTIAMKHGTVFSVTPATLAHTGGTVTVSYTVTAEGEYKDTVVVTGTTMAEQPIVRECPVSVTIDPTAPTGTMVTYNLLQSLTDLQEGDKVFVGTAAKDFVVGLYDYDVASANIRGAAATYSTDHHQVTANDLYAYTVSIDANGKYILTGSDGNYLCDYNAGKNLSSTTTLDNKAKWTITITDDVATIKNVQAPTYQLLFNKTAPNAMFCCYTGIDSNTAAVMLYSDHAPAYEEPELHPAIEVKHGTEVLVDSLKWGEVVYDDSWGTEVAPYAESKSITITGTDLTGNIALSLQTGTHFTLYTTSLAPAGGSVSIGFEATAPGTYTDVLTISNDTIVKTYVLQAKAVHQATPDPEQEPALTVSIESVNIAYSIEDSTSTMLLFTFSAERLAKTLYVKWEKNNEEPTSTGLIELLVDDQEISAGETAQFAVPQVEEAEVLLSVTAYSAFTYTTNLHFYSYKADSKTELAIDQLIPVSIVVTDGTTTSVDNISASAAPLKMLRDGMLYIVVGEKVYDVLGK